MKRLTGLLNLLFVLCLCLSPRVSADAPVATSPPAALIITQLKVRNDVAGYDEYIELYNVTDNPVELAPYSLEYFNTVNPSLTQLPIKAVLPAGLIAAKSYLTLAKNTDQVPNSLKLPLTSLADSGGILRLVQADSSFSQQVTWSSSMTAAIEPIVYLPSTANNKSISLAQSSDGNYEVDPSSWSLVVAQPRSIELLSEPEDLPVVDEPDPLPPAEEPPVTVEPDPLPPELPDLEPVPVVVEQPLLPLQITELLPNPAAPATDTADEFIELYNPNNDPVDLAGYTVQSGTTYSYKHSFNDGTIDAHGYLVLTSAQTVLSLANTSGSARLLNPADQIISEVAPYESAPDGQAWALINGVWQWTTSPTPASDNILTLPLIIVPPKPLPKVVSTKPKTVKATSQKVSTARASAVKAAVSKSPAAAKKAVEQTTFDDNVPAVPPPVHPLVLAGFSGGALLYAGYEYRQDMANRLYQFRRYRAARRAARAAAEGS